MREEVSLAMKKKMMALVVMVMMVLATAAPAFALPQQAKNACQGIDKSKAPETPARSHSPIWPVCQ